MKARIATMVGERTARYLWMGTFHSVFSRILRNEADKIGYSKNFTIYDSSDSNSLIKSIVKELKLDDKQYKHGLVHSRISFAKNNLITPDAYLGNPDLMKADMNARVPMLSDITDCIVIVVSRLMLWTLMIYCCKRMFCSGIFLMFCINISKLSLISLWMNTRIQILLNI